MPSRSGQKRACEWRNHDRYKGLIGHEKRYLSIHAGIPVIGSVEASMKVPNDCAEGLPLFYVECIDEWSCTTFFDL